ncbi:MAG: four helix bundle protein [Butyricicoccus sp.]
MENVIQRRSFHFAVEIVRLAGFLQEQKHEFVLSKQVLRSGTSIGANVREAQQAQEIRRMLTAIVKTTKENLAK